MHDDTRSKTIQVLRSLVLSALLIALPAPIGAETPTEAPEADATAGPAPETPAPAAGLRAYIDPETGEITDRPTAEQVEKLSRALETALLRTAEDLEPFDLTGGGQGLYLAGRFRSATIARPRADGGFDVTCVDSAAEARRLLEAPPPTEAAEPENDTVWEER